jgi:hypothetical protein
LPAQCGCRAYSHFSASKLGENRIAEELYDPAIVALHNGTRERLQDFYQLQRATFVFRGAFAIMAISANQSAAR